MSDTLDFTNKIEPFVMIAASTSVSEALTQLADGPFALIGNTGHPQRLAQNEQLQALANQGSQPLAEVLEHLSPPLVITKEAMELLDTTSLRQVALVLQRTKASGLVVYHNQQTIGVLSRKTIREALPLPAIFATKQKRGDLPGDPTTQAQWYICQECKEEGQAEYIFSPDQGDDVMNCPVDPSHGRMLPYI